MNMCDSSTDNSVIHTPKTETVHRVHIDHLTDRTRHDIAPAGREQMLHVDDLPYTHA